MIQLLCLFNHSIDLSSTHHTATIFVHRHRTAPQGHFFQRHRTAPHRNDICSPHRTAPHRKAILFTATAPHRNDICSPHRTAPQYQSSGNNSSSLAYHALALHANGHFSCPISSCLSSVPTTQKAIANTRWKHYQDN